MIAFLGIPVLAWFTVAVGAIIVALALSVGRIIRGPEAPEFTAPDEPKGADDLDDWLGRDGLDFDFKVYRQPEASVRMGAFDGLR